MFYEIVHPNYDPFEMLKYRYTAQGGRNFINEFLYKLSVREENTDFILRKQVSYCPAFAKSGLNEIKNAITHRMADIIRTGGSASYQKIHNGENGGVDKFGHSMNDFISTKVLPELLIQGKVGIFVDKQKDTKNFSSANNDNPLPPKTLVNQDYPYLYWYSAEQIKNWVVDEDGNVSNVLLEDTSYSITDGLPTKVVTRFRHCFINSSGKVQIDIYDPSLNINSVQNVNSNSSANDNSKIYAKEKLEATYTLDLDTIPFILLELSDSLLVDVANYQIALLNIASSDLGYILKANYPFYIEQQDQLTKNDYLKKEPETEEAKVGATQGRVYGKNLDPPAFIHPSSEPITASMAKQEQLKQEIRLLLQLAVSNLQPSRMASADSKGFDDRTMENGLAVIGITLEFGERRIARIIAEYDGEDPDKVESNIKYPRRYSLKSDKEKLDEATELKTIANTVPSTTFKKEVCKAIVYILLSDKVTDANLNKIYKEIDSLDFIVDPAQLILDCEAGLIDLASASKNSCYPTGASDKAAADHAERLARIAASQTSPDIQGVTDTKNPKEQKQQQQSATTNPNGGTKRTRGVA